MIDTNRRGPQNCDFLGLDRVNWAPVCVKVIDNLSTEANSETLKRVEIASSVHNFLDRAEKERDKLSSELRINWKTVSIYVP